MMIRRRSTPYDTWIQSSLSLGNPIF